MPAPQDTGVSQATQPSATEWLRLLSAKQLSARELTQHYIERVERVNPVLNAVVAFDPDRALAEADGADKARAGGDDRPLLGLPDDGQGCPRRRGLSHQRWLVRAGESLCNGRCHHRG